MIEWGEPSHGLRFGLSAPKEPEAGGSVVLTLHVENVGEAKQMVFGFQPAYPRSLRVSPPKRDRDWIRISFGDTRVLHSLDAFMTIAPGERIETSLDLSFAFDRRGAGRWQLAFAYDPVRAMGRFRPYLPNAPVPTPIITLDVAHPHALDEVGIAADDEQGLDEALLRGSDRLLEALEGRGEAGAAFAARRVARLLAPSSESTIGWRALDALSLMGESGLQAIRQAREHLPHAALAMAFAEEWLAHRLNHPAPQHHLPFLQTLKRVIDEPGHRGNFLMTWTSTDSAIHGLRKIQVLGDGDTIVTIRPPTQDVPISRRSRLAPMEMQALCEMLLYGCVWLLRPLREIALPDEPRPTLELQLALGDPFSRYVAMWNGEWRLGPGAPLAEMLDRLCRERS